MGCEVWGYGKAQRGRQTAYKRRQHVNARGSLAGAGCWGLTSSLEPRHRWGREKRMISMPGVQSTRCFKGAALLNHDTV